MNIVNAHKELNQNEEALLFLFLFLGERKEEKREKKARRLKMSPIARYKSSERVDARPERVKI